MPETACTDRASKLGITIPLPLLPLRSESKWLELPSVTHSVTGTRFLVAQSTACSGSHKPRPLAEVRKIPREAR